ncbi:hypothetical protein FA15DRAFT_374089 [Coprinopsis marcescibilis]|uniref:Uncharacterized protein n=1 Tax=Coprinopsis marcescibilis TaxID=230819 RepID=A0A5C3KWW7_COPMA|nr:hypothetical protein FA15DRAFT_374089 [Coprinopsis marcescibilis]
MGIQQDRLRPQRPRRKRRAQALPFPHQNLQFVAIPWNLGEGRHKEFYVVLLVMSVILFQLIPPGITSLLLPVPFNRAEILVASELDFASNALDCVSWLNLISNNSIGRACGWKIYKNMTYTNCLGRNQLSDVLAAGRSSVLSLGRENNESLTFTQLGTRGGLRIIGPLRGILPIGPDGAPAFDTVQPTSVLANPNYMGAILAYNYTLHLQGLSTNISCHYDEESAVRRYEVSQNNKFVAQSNGTCAEGMDFLKEKGKITSVTPNSWSTLAFWACRASSAAHTLPSYNLYLRGYNSYVEPIGNITCAVNPILPAIYPVTYHSQTKLFTTKETAARASNAHADLVENMLLELGEVVRESQTFNSNLVAEIVTILGVKLFNLPFRGKHDTFLRLYEMMLSGMLDYQAAYSRLLYSTVEGPPQACMRQVDGEVIYTIFGWWADSNHIGYLMPLTILNIATAVLILVSFKKTRPTSMFPLDIVDLTSQIYFLEGDYNPDEENFVKIRHGAVEESAQRNSESFAKASITNPQILSQIYGDGDFN